MLFHLSVLHAKITLFRKAAPIHMNIKDHWDDLDPATQKWLIDNPGCQILPRTIATVISKECGEEATRIEHGQMALSQEDHEFIRTRPAGF